MKVMLKKAVTIAKYSSTWTFSPLPYLLVERRDVFADMKSYYVVFQWLIFQAYMIIAFKKEDEQ